MVGIIIFLVLVVSGFPDNSTLVGGSEYQFDNYFYSRQSYFVSADKAGKYAGTANASLRYELANMSGAVNGIAGFSDEALQITAGYRMPQAWLCGGIDLGAGLFGPARLDRTWISISLPLKGCGLPGSEWISLTPGFRYGTADDGPVAAKVGLLKRSRLLDIGFGLMNWEAHFAFREDSYSEVERERYQQVIADKAFFNVFYDFLNPAFELVDAQTNPLPGNRITQSSICLFGPVRPDVYVGGKFVRKNAEKNFYLPLADEPDGRLSYAFFPYPTPDDEGAVYLILSVAKPLNGLVRLLDRVSSEVTFPAYSYGTYRGYYLAPSGNLLEGFEEFNYHFTGLAEIEWKLDVETSLNSSCKLGLCYSWVSRPYLSYAFFSRNSYQYHSFNLSLKFANQPRKD